MGSFITKTHQSASSMIVDVAIITAVVLFALRHVTDPVAWSAIMSMVAGRFAIGGVKTGRGDDMGTSGRPPPPAST